MNSDKTQFYGLRGVLALWIVLGHMLLNEVFGGIYDAGFARHSDFGAAGKLILLRFLSVDLFFMLTGLVLTRRYFDHFGAHTKGRDIDRFYLHRLKAIYPLHVAMVALVGLYEYSGIPHPLTSGAQTVIFAHWEWTLAVNLLLMNAWGMIPVASWNEPAWTMSITFLTYIVFPNLLIFLKRLPSRAWMYAFSAALFLAAYAVLRETVLEGSQSDGAGAIARGLIFAAVGSLTALYDRVSPPSFWQHYGIFLPLGFIALVVLWTYIYPFPITLFHFTYPALLLGITHSHRRLLPPRIALYFGTRSFALFMTHYPALLLLRHGLGEQLHAIAALGTISRMACYLLAFGWVLLAAEIAYRLNAIPKR